jgi:putative sterol carrier protein
MPKFARAADLFAAVPDAFQSEKADGLATVVAFELHGDDAGHYWVHIEDGACRTGSGAPPRVPDATVRASAGDWLRIVSGDLNPVLATVMGKLKIDGPLDTVLRLADVFPSD